MPASLNPQLEMVEWSDRIWRVFAHLPAGPLAVLRNVIRGREASSFESIRRGLTVSLPALAALDMAMLDLLGKHTRAPVWQVLGGPTRNQARALARIEGDTDTPWWLL